MRGMVDSAEQGTRRGPAWAHASGVLALQPPVVMAILNLTPDSFHDGGRFTAPGGVDVPRVLAHGRDAVRCGARVLDVGGESTRPGAEPVPESEERARVLASIAGLAELGVPISCDTRRATVARAAMAAGASIINDVSGLADADMAAVAAETRAGLVIGHLRGTPQTMQAEVGFADLLGDVADELARSVARAVEAGVERTRIVVDPGVGFGKSAEQSAALVAAASWLRTATGCPVMIGASRKSFIGTVSGADTQTRLPGSLAAALVAVERGASVLRVHDVDETTQALAVAASIRAAYERHAARAAASPQGGR